MKILIKDNFLKEPELFKEIAFSLNNYCENNILQFPPTGWRGWRSRPLRDLNHKKINGVDSQVYKLCYKFFDLDNFEYIIAPPEYRNPETEFTITSYFHITTKKTRDAYIDFCDRFHKDSDTVVAGVIYLNENPPPFSGTSILDGEKTQFLNVENVYNRLIAYKGHHIHSLTDVFGNSFEDGRLTYTFFIHEIKFLSYFS